MVSSQEPFCGIAYQRIAPIARPIHYRKLARDFAQVLDRIRRPRRCEVGRRCPGNSDAHASPRPRSGRPCMRRSDGRPVRRTDAPTPSSAIAKLANCLPPNALGRRGWAEASGLGTDTPASNIWLAMTGRVNARRQRLRIERASWRQRLRIERARVILRHRLCSGECRHGKGGQDGRTDKTNGRRRRAKDSWHIESPSLQSRTSDREIPVARHLYIRGRLRQPDGHAAIGAVLAPLP